MEHLRRELSTSRPSQIPQQRTTLSSWTHTHNQTRRLWLLFGAGHRLHTILPETDSLKSQTPLQRKSSLTARIARLLPPCKQRTKTCLLPQTRESDRDQLLLQMEMLSPQYRPEDRHRRDRDQKKRTCPQMAEPTHYPKHQHRSSHRGCHVSQRLPERRGKSETNQPARLLLSATEDQMQIRTHGAGTTMKDPETTTV